MSELKKVVQINQAIFHAPGAYVGDWFEHERAVWIVVCTVNEKTNPHHKLIGDRPDHVVAFRGLSY